jgi:peptidyl-prolyl cis-trans isomerase C
MLQYSRIAALSLAFAVAAALAAPASAQQGTAPAQTAAPAATPDPATVVVATVDGDKITLAELMAVKSQLPQQYRDMPLEMLYAQLLDQVVERRIIAQAADKAGLEQESEVQAKLHNAREGVLLEAYITREVGPHLTREKLQERYEQQYVAQGGEEEIHARHILVAEQSEAEDIRKQIADGADFAEMAKKHSTGPSGPKGGDLGFFRRKDMVPEFSEAAFKLADGEVSAPVKTQFGWHLIMVVERRKSEPPKLEEVAEELQRQMAREIVTKIVADLRGQADVKLFNIDGSPIVMPQVIKPVK